MLWWFFSVFFFFKQKTAYEMRISDWSSDVCSSDLDQDQVYFSDGLSEDLINALSQIDGLKVIGRNSSFQFRDSQDDTRTIGARLGVAHLLEGSVRHAGDTVRITAQLIRAADCSTLWSEHYDRPFRDLFALQAEIPTEVAREIADIVAAKHIRHYRNPPH